MNIWVPRLKKCGLVVNCDDCDECCGDSYACCVCCSCCEYLSYPCFRGLHHRPCGSYANEQAVTAFPKESGQPVYSVQMLRVQPSIPEKELRLHVQTFYTRDKGFTQIHILEIHLRKATNTNAETSHAQTQGHFLSCRGLLQFPLNPWRCSGRPPASQTSFA